MNVVLYILTALAGAGLGLLYRFATRKKRESRLSQDKAVAEFVTKAMLDRWVGVRLTGPTEMEFGDGPEYLYTVTNGGGKMKCFLSLKSGRWWVKTADADGKEFKRVYGKSHHVTSLLRGLIEMKEPVPEPRAEEASEPPAAA
jgi:hypothetical protein